MCLIKDKISIKKAKDRFKKHRSIVCYKALVFNKFIDGLTSDFFPHMWKTGINKSDIKHKTEENVFVTRGFHVYVHREDAMNATTSRMVVVPVRCFAKDFISAGLNHDETEGMVFSQVELRKEDYNKAVQSKRNIQCSYSCDDLPF